MDDLFAEAPVTLAEQIAEVERELVMRRRGYPRWVQAGKFSNQAAAVRLARLEAVLATLQSLAAGPRDA